MSEIIEAIIKLKSAFHRELKVDLVQDAVGVELKAYSWSQLNHWYNVNRLMNPNFPAELGVSPGAEVLEHINVCGVAFKPIGFWGRTVSKRNEEIYQLQEKLKDKERKLLIAVDTLNDITRHGDFTARSYAVDALEELGR